MQRIPTRWLRRFSWTPTLLALVVLATHFAGTLATIQTPADPAWSRPLLIQTATTDSRPALAVLSDGTTCVFTETPPEGIAFSAAQQGHLVAEQRLLVHSPGAHKLLAVGGGPYATLLWEADDHLWAGLFTSQGQMQLPPEPLAKSVLAYTARRSGENTRVVMAIPDAVLVKTLLPGGGTEESVPLPVPNLITLDAQVLQDGDLLVALVARREKYDILGLARLHNGIWVDSHGLAQVLLGEQGTIERLALAVDFTHVYATYVVNDGTQGLHPAYMVSSTIDPDARGRYEDPRPIPLAVGGALSGNLIATNLVDPTVLPGQNGEAEMAFVGRVANGLDQRVSIVTATLKDGQRLRLALAYGGRWAQHPALANGAAGSTLAFLTRQGVGYKAQLASKDPTWRSTTLASEASDWAAAAKQLAFDLLAIYLPVLVAMGWVLPTIVAVGLFYLYRLPWAADHTERLFWGGVMFATLLQAVMLPAFLGGGPLAPALPIWLSRWVPAILVSLAIAAAGLPTAYYWGRRRGWLSALGPLNVWLLTNVGLVAVLYGPFLHHR